MQDVERAIERVIDTIHEKYGDELTIDDMAHAALYSKFHFTRIFQRATGLTPGRFLSAVRLQKAKQLLISTSFSVTDISHMVGYSSVGTFSSRFGYSVGVPPSIFRRLGGVRPRIPAQDNRNGAKHVTTGGQHAAVGGRVSGPDGDWHNPIFVGLFSSPIPQSQPVRCAVLARPGSYVLDDVPAGTWHVMACCEIADCDIAAAGRQPLAVGSSGPISVRPGTVRLADVRLRPMGPLDPPVLLALPDMRVEPAAARQDAVA